MGMDNNTSSDSAARILVVEDELIIAKGIQKRLQALGYSVAGSASSGEEAVEKALRLLPDLVLMDINLQGAMDGVTAAELIRTKADMPVIFLTAYADADTLERAKVTEPFGYIVKPFQDITLQSSIEMALYKHRMETRLRSSQQWLSTILRSIADGVIATDGEGVVTFMNPVAEEMTGWDLASALSRPLDEVFRVRCEGCEETLADLAGGGRGKVGLFTFSGDLVLLSRDGREIPIEAKGTALSAIQGASAGVALALHDITERVRFEEALRRSEKSLAVKNHIANIFLTISDEDMYGEVLNLILKTMKSRYGFFGYLDENRSFVVPSLTMDVWDECRVEEKTLVYREMEWTGLWGRALRERVSFSSNGPFTVPEGHVKLTSLLTVPIVYRQESIGLIAVANKEGGFSEEDMEFLESLSLRIAPILHARLQRDREEKERNRAEDELRKSAQFLRAVFDAIPDLFSIIDRDHRILLSNYHGGFDYVPEDIRDCFPFCYKAYYGRDEMCEPCHALEVFNTGKMVQREKYNPRIGYMEIRSFPIFDDDGEVILVAEHVHDITQRRMAQDALAAEKERLAVTLRSIGDGVITTDISGRVVLLNKVAEELTGWRQDEARGRALPEVFRIINEKTRLPCPDPVERVLASGLIVELCNHTILVSREGKERIVADSAAPIKDRESRIVGAVLVFRDTTEKRKMEEELLKSQKLESIGVLAGGIAHDFNNLLTAILGNISLSKMYVPPGEKVYQKLEEAEKASLRARDLTQQLLTFSRGGAPVRKTAAVTDIIRDSVAFTLSGSRATYRFSIADDIWPVEVDEGQMSQVINNLILNADQAMPSGGIIEVGCSNLSIDADTILPLKEGHYVVIAIKDQGTGISREALPRIFDPYFSTKKDGKGLGLATVYSIVRNHDGHITVNSAPGEGTTFTIYLPASFESAVDSRTEEAEEHTGRGTVLVMDDEENIRDVAGEMLKFIGYDVKFAADGAEAVDLYRSSREAGEPFAAVIMDLTIPGGMGGKEAVMVLRDIDPDVRAIVSSGYSNDPIMADYRKYGFRGIITKPYKLGDLKKMLAQVTV